MTDRTEDSCAVQCRATRQANNAATGKLHQTAGTLGQRLQSLRKAKGITGHELARRLGTNQATVWVYDNLCITLRGGGGVARLLQLAGVARSR